jgi:hypothetical protein
LLHLIITALDYSQNKQGNAAHEVAADVTR